MGRYLGTVKIVNTTYVNFMPFYLLDYGKFVKLTMEDRYSLFPKSEILNINLYSDSADRYEFASRFSENKLYIVDLKNDLFEDNINPYGEYNKTRYKYNVDRLKNGKYGTIDAFGYYYYLDSGEVSNDYTKSFLNIFNSSVCKDDYIVIANPNGNEVMGPFKVGQRTGDGEKVVVIHEKDRRGNDLYLVHTMIFNNAEYELQSVIVDEIKYVLFDSSSHQMSYKDVISDGNLLAEFTASIDKSVLRDGYLDVSDTSRIVDNYNSSSLRDYPESIRQNRINRLTKILNDEQSKDNYINEICKIVTNLLVVKKDSQILEPVFRELSENKAFINSIPQIQVLTSKLKEMEKAIGEKQQELDAIDQELVVKRNEELEAKFSSEYEELQSKIKSACEELAATKIELDEARGTLDKQEYLKRLEGDIDYLKRKNEDQRKESEIIKKEIDSIFDDKTEKALNLAFDGMISQKMIQAAASWETMQQNKQYEGVICALVQNSNPSMTEDELIDYLCGIVSSYRPNYDRNTILNMFICIAQGFLTVFSGAPGAGKTSACNIVAHALGLLKPSTYMDHSFNIDPNRFIDVSVERGWTSKRDFIGYYNPLTKKFDRNNSRLFDALNILDLEARGNETNRPFIVLLDEANLSPMEYYWADFMNVCDDRSRNSSIDLGEDYRFIIPEELRFVATINNDHTTESLSPRLVDRAWVIRLPNAKSGLGRITTFDESDNREVLWSDFINVFGKTSVELSGVAKDVYDGFVSKAKKIHVRVSPRSDLAIRRYWSVASRIMEKDESVMLDPSIVALDYAVSQKILPQISGSGDTMRNGLEEMRIFALEKNLNMTASVLEEIIGKGDESMNFYQYFG